MSELWRPRIEFRGRSTYSAPPVVSRAPSPPPAPKRPGAPLAQKPAFKMPEGGIGYGQTRREAPLKSLKAGKKRSKKTLRRRQKKTRRHRGGVDEEPTPTPAETYPGEVAEVDENPTSPKGGRGKKKGSRKH